MRERERFKSLVHSFESFRACNETKREVKRGERLRIFEPLIGSFESSRFGDGTERKGGERHL